MWVVNYTSSLDAAQFEAAGGKSSTKKTKKAKITADQKCSHLEVADVRLVKPAVELLDRLFYFAAKESVCASDHFIVCHHVIVQRLLDDILRYHAANFSGLV